ncbi:glycosyltransferase family 4 protein [Pedobacter vanadiisoli]|uniref:Glycosyltransferase family 4 protein n=1 Tax=Pedobacter vanadiisoli TaxID=1761975 RepID=A0ABW5MLJ8_9SPHI
MIYINGRFLGQRTTGVQRFALEIVKKLILIDNSIRIIVPKEFATSLSSQVKQEFLSNLIFWGKGNGLIWEQVILPFYPKKSKSVLLNLCNSAPILWASKLTCIHDMSYRANPQWFSKEFRNYYAFLIPLIAKTSKRILTVSEFSKSEIIKYLGISECKIKVVYNACADIFRNESFPSNKLYQTKTIVFVGSIEPRKNLISLLKAFSKNLSPDIKLVIVGSKNSNTFNSAGTEELNDSRITWEQSCTDQDLKEIYLKSDILINCSLYEGFGVPIIEAANNGCILALSDIPSFREIAGDSAVYFDPLNIDDIGFTIARLTSDSTQNLALLGKKTYQNLSNKYSWERSAVSIYEILKINF